MQETKSELKFLTEEDIIKIVKKIKKRSPRDLRDIAIIETLFSTGLRISECLALPDTPFVGSKSETIELSIMGKGKFQRTVYFSPKAVSAIKNYLSVRDDQDIRLFPTSVRNVQKVLKNRARKAGILGVHPHIIRHSFAVHLLGKGVNIFFVKEFLGHRALSSTQRYLHVSNAELKSIHNKIYK